MAGSASARTKVTLKAVKAYIPDQEGAKQMLMEDLERMGCEGLTRFPWCLKDKEMVREIVDGCSNVFDGSLRANPLEWTAARFREVYGFKVDSGQGLCSRKVKVVKDLFGGGPDSHDGYKVENCTEIRIKAVLEFLAPIINPEKPLRLQVRLANTIVGAFRGVIEVDWGVLIRDLVQRLAKNVGKTRPSPLSPFLYHLYRHHEILSEKEEDDYKLGLTCFEAGLQESDDEDEGDEAPATEDTEEEEEGDDGDEGDSSTDTDGSEDGPRDDEPEVMEIPAAQAVPRTHKKVTAPDSRGIPPRRAEGTSVRKVPRTGTGSNPAPAPAQPVPGRVLRQHPDPMENACWAIEYAQEEYMRMQRGIEQLCNDFSVPTLAEVREACNSRPKVEDVQALEREITEIQLENTRLREQVRMQETELEKNRTMLMTAAEEAVRLGEICEVPAEVRQEANLYREGILNSEVFKAEAFKKFIKSTMNYTKKVEDSNQEVKIILDQVRVRMEEATRPRASTALPSPRPVPIQIPTHGEGTSRSPHTPLERGRKPVEEGQIPSKIGDSPAKNTRSVVRKLGEKEFANSPAGKKLHEIGLEDSEEEVLPDSPTESGDEYEVVDGKRVKVGRASSRKLKRLKKAGERSGKP